MKRTPEGLRLVSVGERDEAVAPARAETPGVERLQGIRALLLGHAAPEPGAAESSLLRPEAAWLLVCLMRQLARQRWLVRVVEERVLQCRFGEGLDFVEGLEVDEDSGGVPGLPGWRFDFHGRGCRLTGPGEVLDVDAYGDAGATIDPYFFTGRLFSLASPGFPEVRLMALLPGASLVAQVIRELQVEGFLTHRESDHVFRLPPELEALAEAAGALESGAREARERMALLLGDFELLGGREFADRAWANREARLGWLIERASVSSASDEAFATLRPLLSPEVFVRTCVRVIEGPPSRAVAAAIEHLDPLEPGPEVSEVVLGLLRRVSPAEHHPGPVLAAARFLLRRGVERERVLPVFLAFARAEKVPGFSGNPLGAEFAFVAMEYVPEHALELVRRALRSSTPIVRTEMAAVLCLLDQPWGQRELISALQDPESKGLDGQRHLQLALARSRSEWARAVAARWLRQRPPLPTAKFGYSPEEVLEANAEDWFEQQLEEQRAWVERMKVRIPEGVG